MTPTSRRATLAGLALFLASAGAANAQAPRKPTIAPLSADDKALVDKATAYLQGLTQVKVDVETFMDDTTNKASLHFIIREGFRMKIKRINVYGNTAYRDKKIIKAMKSRPAWLFNTGFLKEEDLEEDMTKIQCNKVP